MSRYSDTDQFLDRWCVMEKLARSRLGREECLNDFMEELFHANFLTSHEYDRFRTLRGFRNELVHYYDTDLQAEIVARLPELTDLVEAVVRGERALRESNPIRKVETRIQPGRDVGQVKRAAPGAQRILYDPETTIPKQGGAGGKKKRPGDDSVITDREVEAWARIFEKGKGRKE